MYKLLILLMLPGCGFARKVSESPSCAMNPQHCVTAYSVRNYDCRYDIDPRDDAVPRFIEAMKKYPVVFDINMGHYLGGDDPYYTDGDERIYYTPNHKNYKNCPKKVVF